MMTETMEQVLSAGGKSNSLERVNDVITHVLKDKAHLDELYACMFSENAWTRMRAADALEKICRTKPDWIEQYITRVQKELSDAHQQPSIKWHIAQIYRQVTLNDQQKRYALSWLSGILSSSNIDWIVAANCMETLAYFTQKGDYPIDALISLLRVQQGHKSKSVIRKADKLLAKWCADAPGN